MPCSESRPQSKKQQQFNNRLVGIIYSTALQCGYTFDSLSFSASGTSARKPSSAKADGGDGVGDGSFNYKKLRDRVRCYYKTHVQNSKKRLTTLLKNPARPRNREVLVKIVDEVRDREKRGDGVRRKLSPNGAAAVRRLEEQEGSANAAAVVSPSFGFAAASESDQSPCGTVAPSGEARVQTAKWHGPSSPRRVSLDPSDHGMAKGGSSEALPFASPCKLEHAAILQSIREVSVRL